MKGMDAIGRDAPYFEIRTAIDFDGGIILILRNEFRRPAAQTKPLQSEFAVKQRHHDCAVGGTQ